MDFVTLLTLLLAMFTIASFQAGQDVIYEFSVGGVRICPLVVPSPNPSFALQPFSSDFPIGNYTYPMPAPDGFRFIQQTKLCASGRMCTELSVGYDPAVDLPEHLRSSFTITFTYDGGRQVTNLKVDYGFKGIYVVKGDGVLRREANNTLRLDGSILVYGVVAQPLVVCDTSGNVSDMFSIFLSKENISCAKSTQSTGDRPVRSNIFLVQADAMGEHVLYVAANNNCLSSLRSEEFTVSLDPALPTTSEDSSLTTVDIGATEGGSDLGLIAGVVSFAVLLLVLLVIVVVIVLVIFVRKRQKRQVHEGRYVPPFGVGAPSPCLKESSKLLPENHQNGTVSHGNGDVNVQSHDMKCNNKDIMDVAFAGPESSWCEALKTQLSHCHNTGHTTIEDFLPIRGTLADKGRILYIIRDLNGEIVTTDITINPPPRHIEVMRQVESWGSDEACRDNVFVVQFKASEERHFQLPHYHLLTRKEDPTTAGFSSSSCAQSIHNKVKEIREPVESVDGHHERLGEQMVASSSVDKQTITLNAEEEQSSVSGNEQDLFKEVKELARKQDEMMAVVKFQGDLTRSIVKAEAEELQVELAASVDEVISGREDAIRRSKEKVENPCEDP